MADYLTRNLEVLAEARQVVSPIRLSSEIVGEGTKNWFVSCGNFQSASQRQLVHAGIKFSVDEQEALTNQFCQALTNTSLIAEKHPELAHQLPLFYGLIVTPANKPKAILSQDFSQGGQYQVKEYRQFHHANIPDGLVDLFDPFGADMIQLERAIFYANGERKIGDLNHLHPKEKYREEWDGIRQRVASENHTLPFTRLPLEQLLPDEIERRYANLVLEMCKDGSKEHIEVIHADSEYRINLSTQINRVLDTLVDGFYLDCWRDKEHPCKDRVFALID